MLKTVYRSSCRDKHNCQRCDSNLGPLTPLRRANHSATETCKPLTNKRQTVICHQHRNTSTQYIDNITCKHTCIRNTFNYSVVCLASWRPNNCISVQSTAGHMSRVRAPRDWIHSSRVVAPFSGYQRLQIDTYQTHQLLECDAIAKGY